MTQRIESGDQLILIAADENAIHFYTAIEAAKARGEVAIGYHRAVEAHNAELSFGVKLNPRKTQTITFAKEDRLIVLAES